MKKTEEYETWNWVTSHYKSINVTKTLKWKLWQLMWSSKSITYVFIRTFLTSIPVSLNLSSIVCIIHAKDSCCFLNFLLDVTLHWWHCYDISTNQIKFIRWKVNTVLLSYRWNWMDADLFFTIEFYWRNQYYLTFYRIVKLFVFILFWELKQQT